MDRSEDEQERQEREHSIDEGGQQSPPKPIPPAVPEPPAVGSPVVPDPPIPPAPGSSLVTPPEVKPEREPSPEPAPPLPEPIQREEPIEEPTPVAAEEPVAQPQPVEELAAAEDEPSEHAEPLGTAAEPGDAPKSKLGEWVAYHRKPMEKWNRPKASIAEAAKWWLSPMSLLLWVCVLAFVALFVVQACVYWVAVIDDSYITFRFVDMFVKGHGWRFSPEGPRVEGFTNFLWAALLVIPHWLGMDLMLVSKIMGMACGVLTMIAAWALARVIRQKNDFINLIPVAVIATNAHFAHWAMMGLETLLQTALVTACYYRFEKERRDPCLWLLSPVIAALAAMTRIDSLYYMSPLGLYGLWLVLNRLMPLKRMLLWGAIAAVIFGSWYGWKVMYFGDLLPNTYYAKQRHVEMEGHGRGSKQLEVYYTDQAGEGFPATSVADLEAYGAVDNFLSGRTFNSLLWMNFWLLSLSFCALAMTEGIRRRKGADPDAWAGKVFCLVLAPWALNIYYVWHVNGDWMPNFRFFQIAIPFIGVAGAVGFGYACATAGRLAKSLPASLVTRAAVLFLAGVLVYGTAREQLRIHHVYIFSYDKPIWGNRDKNWFSKEKIRYEFGRGFAPPLAEVSNLLMLFTVEDGWVFMSDIGQPLWFAEDLQLYDVDGLTDPHLAHAPSRRGDLPPAESYLTELVTDWKSDRLRGEAAAILRRHNDDQLTERDDNTVALLEEYSVSWKEPAKLPESLKKLSPEQVDRLAETMNIPLPSEVPQPWPPKKLGIMDKLFSSLKGDPTEQDRLEAEARRKDYEAHIERNAAWIMEEKRPEYLLLFLYHEKNDPKSTGWAYPQISAAVHGHENFEDYVEVTALPKIGNSWNHFYRRKDVPEGISNTEKIERIYRAMERNPNMPILNATLFITASKADDISDELRARAQETVLAGIDKWPGDPIVSQIASEARRSGDTEFAISVLETTLKTAPENLSAYWTLSSMYQSTDRKKAAEVLEQGLEFAPSNDNSMLYHLIWLHEQMGDPDKALRYASEAISRNPRDVRAWSDYATVSDRSAGRAKSTETKIRFLKESLHGWNGFRKLSDNPAHADAQIQRIEAEIERLENSLKKPVATPTPAPTPQPTAPPSAQADEPTPPAKPQPTEVPRDLSLRYAEQLFPNPNTMRKAAGLPDLETSYRGTAPTETSYQGRPAANIETDYQPRPTGIPPTETSYD